MTKASKSPVVSVLLLISVFLFSVSATLAQEQERAPQIKGSTWFNAGGYKKISNKALLGKVVLVFFWTSNDTNCDSAARTLNEWYLRYKNKGFEIIGVNSPEWQFESSHSAIFSKIDILNIKFPVVIDEDSSMRIAYAQQMWPSFCLIDRDGYIRAQYKGFYTYRDIEKMLKTLLEEKDTQVRLRRDSKI